MNINQEECCPKFNPEQWDCNEIVWSDKLFIKDSICTIFYMPFNMSKVMKRIFNLTENANVETPDYLILADHTSKWNMDIYVAVSSDISNAQTVKFSGKYLSKVYEGNFKDTGKWIKDFELFASSKNHKIKKTYLWYTTCPKCAKKYGKNYVVIVGLIE